MTHTKYKTLVEQVTFLDAYRACVVYAQKTQMGDESKMVILGPDNEEGEPEAKWTVHRGGMVFDPFDSAIALAAWMLSDYKGYMAQVQWNCACHLHE